MASYNRAERLARALDSVAAQTFTGWECLVCDDASTDASVEVARNRAAADPRFHLTSGPHAGLPAAPRNRGIRAARGEWVAFLDDDDEWHPEKLRRQVALAERENADAVSVRSLHYVGSQRPPLAGGTEPAVAVVLGLADVLVPGPHHPDTSATLVRRARLVEAGGFAEAPAYRAVEDFDLWCRLLLTPGFRWIADTSVPLVAYREHGEDSISAWQQVLDPDVIRQRWALLECTTRIVGAAPAAVLSNRRAAIEQLVGRAVECAGRCRTVGWKTAAAAAYAIAAMLSLSLRDAKGAALQSSRMARARLTNVCRTPAPMPEIVPELARRARASAFRLLGGPHAGSASALPLR